MVEIVVVILCIFEEWLFYGEIMIVEVSWDIFFDLLEEGNYLV